MDLALRVLRRGRSARITLTGDLDAYTVPRLRRAIGSLIRGGATTLTVDMGSVGYVDSFGAGGLVWVRRTLGREGGSLSVLVGEGKIRRTLTFMGFRDILVLPRV
jgi:anti-sigma B factor antagonist